MELTEAREKNTLVIGDFHFGVKSNSIQWLDTMKNYFDDIKKLIASEQIEKVVFLGDIFDIRYSTNTLIGISIKEIFRNLITTFKDIDFHIVAGNHDYYSPKKEDMHLNSYEMIFGHEFLVCHYNIHIYTENPYLDKDGDLFMPWFFTEDEELFNQTIEHYKGEKINRVFCHSDLCAWPDSKVRLLNGAAIFAGHIHTPWTDNFRKLYNLSSALSFNFNDVNQTKYVYKIVGQTIIRKYENCTTPVFLRYFDEQILHQHKFENCFVQLYINKNLVNKAEYIEKVKELKNNNPTISIRVVTVDEEFMKNVDTGLDMNQDIKKYIDNNIPENLHEKYEIIKNKIEEKKK